MLSLPFAIINAIIVWGKVALGVAASVFGLGIIVGLCGRLRRRRKPSV